MLLLRLRAQSIKWMVLSLTGGEVLHLRDLRETCVGAGVTRHTNDRR